MPALGLAQETGRLLRWIKQEGEEVAVGDLLMEIETDKSAVEIEAPVAGRLRGIRTNPGDEVAVGTVMAWILAEGEDVPTVGEDPAAVRPAAPPPESIELNRGGFGVPRDRVAASPLARRLARESRVELTPGGGSGPEGAYLAADLTPDAQGGAGMATARRRVALHTTRVWTTTPHFYLSRDVRAGTLQGWREELRRRSGEPVTYTDLLLRVVAAALIQHPQMSDYWVDGEIKRREGGQVALAIATEQGLLLATVSQAQEPKIRELVAARQGAVERAQRGKQSGADLAPASITISNLGMFGVDRFEAVLTEGQSSLLAVGRIRDEVVAVHGRPSVEPVLSLTLSCDHRVLDGAVAAPFLATLVSYLEQPALLLDGDQLI